MVALGNNRNNGANLGAFYLNSNNALGNSNGNNWRSRYTIVSHKQDDSKFDLFSPTQSSGALASPTTQGVVARDAVKDLHTSAVSRARMRLGDRGLERWTYAA